MKRIFWFATGIAAGLAVAKQLRENPEAKAALDDVAKRAKSLGDSFTSGYREREAELRAPKPRAAKTTSKTPVKMVANKKPIKRTTKPVAK